MERWGGTQIHRLPHSKHGMVSPIPHTCTSSARKGANGLLASGSGRCASYMRKMAATFCITCGIRSFSCSNTVCMGGQRGGVEREGLRGRDQMGGVEGEGSANRW